ncbi:MAG: helix-turn-helix domain-containing protein [Candidatus Aenigmatarchaeota archaeon]
MECELCGRNATLVQTEIEGIILSVCSACSNLGKRAEISVEISDKRQNRMDFNTIDPNFSKIIMSSRTKAGLSLEDMGKKINEKASVLERVERGMRPTDELAKKLEKALKIKMLGYQEQ